MILTEQPVTKAALQRWGFDEDPPALLIKLPLQQRYWKTYRSLNGFKWGLHRIQCLPGERHNWLWKYAGIRPADFALCAGTEAEKHPLIGPHTAILRCCSPEVFRLDEIDNEAPPHPYMVFLDEATDLPHPDYARLRRTPPDRITYLMQLDSVLKRLEWRYELPIVIAQHPARRGPFPLKDYPAHNNVTPTMIAHASCVLAHSSTSIGVAVLLKKPIEIIELLCLLDRPEGRLMIAMKHALARSDYATRYLGTQEVLAKPHKAGEVLLEWLNQSK